jgi:disulfide bond formation protein DsbB
MEQQAPEIIFAVLLGGTLIIWLGILLFSKAVLRKQLQSISLELATMVAMGATLGSLYFSEVQNFVPCVYCWYQRIAMYPLALILLIATIRRDKNIIPYALSLSLSGVALSAYHYQLQLFPEQSSSCGLDASCTYRWIEVFGFVTIPLLALTSFAFISMILIATPRPWKTPQI